MSPEFGHISDPRDRLRARLNWSMRPGTVEDEPLVFDVIKASTANLTDSERGVLARHLLEAIEDEAGASEVERLTEALRQIDVTVRSSRDWATGFKQIGNIAREALNASDDPSTLPAT